MKNINELVNECLQCKKPSCVEGCPAHNNIPLYISYAKEGKFDEALKVINETSTLPSICSLVCPSDKQCKGHCIKNKMNKPVSINEIEQYITTKANNPKYDIKKNNYKVALIGSGPASLACAEKLAILGYSVDVYDKYDVEGGILTYGIPDFVLDKKIIKAKIDYLKSLGINFILNKEYGKDITIDSLSNYNAIFLGFGAGIGKKMNIEGEDFKGVIDANYFLEKTYKNSFDDVDNVKNVIVVGGGNTAIDAARVAKRYFNCNVSIVYRRSEVEMPARHDEYLKAINDGISFNFLTNPLKYFGENGYVKQAICNRMRLGEVVDGRAKPIVIEGSEFTIDADLVVLAVSSAIDKKLTNGLDIESWGGIIVNENMQTSNPKVFAGGDCVSGPSLVVNAMVDGIKAAKGIDKYLKEIK